MELDFDKVYRKGSKCNQKRRVHIPIEHPGKAQILTELKSLRSPDWIAAPWSFPPLRLCTRLNLCAHIDLQTYMVCILETLAALITEIRTLILPIECTETDYLRSLPICYHSDSSPDLVLSNNDPWHTHVQRDHRPISSIECNNKILTALFLTQNLCAANIDGANRYKNVKCTDSWSPSFQHSLQVLALMLTLSYYLWFLVPYYHSLQSCFLMLITTSLAGYWRNGKFCNQSNALPCKTDLLLYLQIFGILWFIMPASSCTTSFFTRISSAVLLLAIPKKSLLQNFPPSLWIASSFAAMHPQPLQIVIAAPPRP